MRRNHVKTKRPAIALCLVVFAGACSSKSPSVLEPAGPGAAEVVPLWWLMFWISSAVFLVVVVLIGLSLRRKGGIGEPLIEEEGRWGNRFVLTAGVIIPFVILSGVFLLSLTVMKNLAARGEESTVAIQVDGRMWWWDVKYSNGARTANEIHIPVGEPVRLKLTASDVIHSFWVPQLQVKVDMIPGKTNELWMEADKPGRYRGQCAEYCGLQHANMVLYVVAEPRPQFEAWLANESSPAGEPAGANAMRGREVFVENSCLGCHAIRGTEATSEFGPDLTHLAKRETLASGIIANNRENLERFITEPGMVKPGDTMPPTSLSPGDLAALVEYLGQLE